MQELYDQLSELQRKAVYWNEGPMMVLAGSGAGKTMVLTARLATILHENANQNFRLLALTYTNKAADEMRRRVDSYIPYNKQRLFVGTFHSFCANILRQHGSHIGIQPDFKIFDQMEDRIELLEDTLNGEFVNENFNKQDFRHLLRTIDQLRRKVIGYEEIKNQFCDTRYGETVAEIYKIYENSLQAHNALDLNGLILNACRLLEEVSRVGSLYRSAFRYWSIDEFQNTTVAQHKFVELLAGGEFRNIFLVADDDQKIFHWAGASFDTIKKFKEDYNPEIVQLIENRCCPSQIVELADNLMKHDTERLVEKQSLVSSVGSSSSAVSIQVYSDELHEASETAKDIVTYIQNKNQSLAVLGRSQASLEIVLDQLTQRQVKASIAKRGEHFVSPYFIWLMNSLKLASKPNDRRTFESLTNSGNMITGTEFDPEIIIAEPLSTGRSYLEHWVNVVNGTNNSKAKKLAYLASQLIHSRASWRKIVNSLIETLLGLNETSNEENTDDTLEDWEAWRSLYNSISSSNKDNLELHEFLHGMKLWSKEPPSSQSEVRLYTIHSAKGLEFDHVWMIGMADTILPSWHSLKEGAKPQLLEEERRACFVGMTRAKKTLTFSYPKIFKGFKKEPSRFLREMGMISN